MLKEIIKYVDDNIKENEEVIKSLLAHSIGFQLNGTKEDSISKIGGMPSMDKNLFPCLNGEPLTFIGQIDLSEISSANDILPSTGLLLFFVYTGDLGYRYPDRKGEFRVVYLDEISSTPEFVQVIDEKCQLMSFFQFYTFPSYQEGVVEKKNISNDDLNTIDEIQEHILWGLENDYDAPHQILGHPHAIQGTVRFWWAASYLNIDPTVEDFSEDERGQIDVIEDEFLLLLQLNFLDSKIDIKTFGDSVVYFGIHKEDLRSNSFENAVLVMQCT
ncbi:Uncharacterized protein YwqG [Sphingobacterium nematocida]|uniref:Uncharacterized protein YwqG n=1 Tax=Sphingobacterium nematocida TaxID=1513896 RepID=A0A1T5DPM6_9SPHI|nr:DUF1963 domain-containing protein [Sphingobacterium nematocida]SKB73625.1 Uncharacterized protein YwqG [Sphingobacterium nematocida]